MFFFQWQCKAIDNRAKNLQQLRNSIKALCLVNELEEDIIDGAANIRPQVQKLAVDSVQGCLQEVSFSRILRIEQFQKLGCRVISY